MDLFARTFLPAAADAGLPVPAINRHMMIFRRCVGAATPVLTVARCIRADRPLAGPHLLVLSPLRLVVTHESRVVHRIRLHLDAALTELSAISWAFDPRRGALEFVATALAPPVVPPTAFAPPVVPPPTFDGTRERFWIQARHPKTAAAIEATLRHAFRVATHAQAPPGTASHAQIDPAVRTAA